MQNTYPVYLHTVVYTVTGDYGVRHEDTTHCIASLFTVHCSALPQWRTFSRLIPTGQVRPLQNKKDEECSLGNVPREYSWKKLTILAHDGKKVPNILS